MGYINFPAAHTEEEQMLQAKYQKLKKKVWAAQCRKKYPYNSSPCPFILQKKALHALKSPKPEIEKPILKRPADARDAREVARKVAITSYYPDQPFH